MSATPFNQPYEYIKRIFESQTAKNGGVVRRKVADVKAYASFNYLLKDVEARGFHLIEAGEHYIIFCSSESIKFLR